MAKDKSGGKSGAKAAKIPKQIAGVKIPKGLRDSGNAAMKLAQSPMARELLSAGLAAAAAAVVANGRARKTAQQSGEEIKDTMSGAVNAAAESAGKIGTAFVEAASVAAQQIFAAGKMNSAAPAPPAVDPETQASASPIEDADEPSSEEQAEEPVRPPRRTAATSARANGATGKASRIKSPSPVKEVRPKT